MKTLDVNITKSSVTVQIMSPISTEKLNCFRQEEIIAPKDSVIDCDSESSDHDEQRLKDKILTIIGNPA